MDKIEVDVNEIPGRFADLVAKVTAGEEVVVTDGGEPKVKLEPIPDDNTPVRRLGLGVGQGTFWIAPDFDDPLPDEFWLGDDS